MKLTSRFGSFGAEPAIFLLPDRSPQRQQGFRGASLLALRASVQAARILSLQPFNVGIEKRCLHGRYIP
jgi:hypothetical protein